jgi:hypothetical protein
MSSDEFLFEEIPENEAEISHRGRKSNAPDALVKAIASAKAGKVLRITSFTVNPKLPNAKTEKARISAVIRSAGKLAGKTVSMSWTLAGVPQVAVSPLKKA